jgi:hypothetical protein
MNRMKGGATRFGYHSVESFADLASAFPLVQQCRAVFGEGPRSFRSEEFEMRFVYLVRGMVPLLLERPPHISFLVNTPVFGIQ